MTRRTIPKPLGIPGAATYFRLRVYEVTPDGDRVDRGYHNQPFETHDAAASAAAELTRRAGRAGKRVGVDIVPIRAL